MASDYVKLLFGVALFGILFFQMYFFYSGSFQTPIAKELAQEPPKCPPQEPPKCPPQEPPKCPPQEPPKCPPQEVTQCPPLADSMYHPRCPNPSLQLIQEISIEDIKIHGHLADTKLSFCKENPYISFLKDKDGGPNDIFWKGEEEVERIIRGAPFLSACLIRNARKWDRFQLFNPTIPCPSLKKYPNTNLDGTKILCNLEEIQSPCIIYSLGSNQDYMFEDQMLVQTDCEVFTFDCTVGPGSHKNPKINYHEICLGPKSEIVNGWKFQTLEQITTSLGHKNIDLLKMDIEGFEDAVFRGWVPTMKNLPFQFVVELHTNMLSGEENVMMVLNLLKMGYRIVSRDDNSRYSGGTELTFVRVRC